MSEVLVSAEVEERERLARIAGFPVTVLGLVQRGGAADSVAYVGAMLESALAELAETYRTVSLFPEDGGSPTLLRRTLFAGRLMVAERNSECALFNHVGVATAQARLPQRVRRPYALWVHGPEVLDPEMSPARRRALHEATITFVNSAQTAERVHEAHPDIARPAVLPLALLPAHDGGRVDGALVASVTPRTVVIAGRMSAGERYKGHDELLEAWQTVLARRPDARLAIVGQGDDAKRLEAKSIALGLTGSVRFTGYVSDSTLDAMLARAAAFALPSRGEGFGLAYLRAMRAALPCIAGADDGAREVLEDGVTGVLVPQGDRDALGQAVIGMLGDTVRRRTMGEAGKERFERHFTYDRFVARLDEVMRDALTPHLPR
jgi:glycosyltransferase involved in cell wall biosynthesis